MRLAILEAKEREISTQKPWWTLTNDYTILFSKFLPGTKDSSDFKKAEYVTALKPNHG